MLALTRSSLFAALASMLLAASISQTSAQTFPDRVLKIVVPFPPGGPTDILARTVGRKLTDKWGQPVVIENRPGAAGAIGAEAVVRSPPDGYTLLLSNVSDTISATLNSNLRYSFVQDLRPVAMLGTTPLILVAHPSLNIKSVSDLVAKARSEPGKLVIASSGNGSITHLAGILLKAQAQIDILTIPYKGQSEATSDVVSGRVPLMFSNPMVGMSLVKSGSLVAIGVSPDKRVAASPDVPTISESGLPGYNVDIWYGLHVPAKTPDEIVNKLADAVLAIMKEPDVKESLDAQGAVVETEGPAAFDARVRSDVAKWAKVIKDENIPIQ